VLTSPPASAPRAVGKLMIQDFLIAFEAASLLLMLAAVAAIILAGKKKQPSKGPVS
jgi:NADH:ubiquinone oxidoreductase subunit 6 (subunit J)